MVVHSDGLDEISTMGPTKIIEFKNGTIIPRELNCSDYGIAATDSNTIKAAILKPTRKS